MPQINTRYPVVVGESFWRLTAYVDSVPARKEERVPGKCPHVLVKGVSGCGKSYLMAAASALLGFGPQSMRPQQLNYLSSDYRTVFIGDCKRWLESDDPLTYFRMELLAGFRDNCQDVDDHHSPDHLGCLICVEPFTRVEQIGHFMEKCCRWVEEHQPDTLFVFFIDQAEELVSRPDSIPYQIVSLLVKMQSPLVIFSVTSPVDSSFPFQYGTVIDIPYRVTSAEFAKHLEVHSGLEEKALYKDVNWWKDMRLWTGSIPSEITELARMPGPSVPHRLKLYRKMVLQKVQASLLAVGKLDGKQRNVLLIVVFAIILRVPMDMSGEFTLANIMSLGPAITNHFLLNCLQAFYHTSDGIITMKDVPATLSMAVHMALCSVSVLSSVIRTWPSLFENVVHAMMHSKLLCSEAKRRMARFYIHAKLLWGRPDWSFEGSNEMGDTIRFKFRQPRVVIFAGQTPVPGFIMPNGPDAEHHGVIGNGDYDAVAFIPGRTSYWFFDLFILVPEDRRLYAITTSTVVGTWLKELQTRVGPMQLQQQREDGLLTPVILLDHWKDALRKAGLPKVIIKCCVVKPLDLMISAGYKPPVTTDETLESLATHLQSTVVIKDEE
jgi:hypothetical protein